MNSSRFEKVSIEYGVLIMNLPFFLIVCLSLFSSAYSYSENVSEGLCPSSIMTIEAVDSSDKMIIVLNNGTMWSCTYNDLFEGSYGWCLGDRVDIVYVYTKGYYLQNASSPGCVPVKLQNINSPDLKVNTIKEIIKDEEELTNIIILDDATNWFIGSWSSNWMSDWQAGDRIIVTEQEFILGKADHLLLNLDRGTKNSPENVRAELLFSPDTIQYEDLNKRENRDWKISIANTWQARDSLLIELNNKTLWKCSQSKLDWLPGDNLEFEFDYKECKLINLRNSEKINVSIIHQDSKEIDLPTIHKISKRGNRVMLSDESVWFSGRNAFKHWQEGQRVIVSSLSEVTIDTSTHTLINIDIPCEKKDKENHRLATLVK